MNLISRTRIFTVVFAAALSLSACTLVSPYDPVVDKNINEVAINTETILFMADNGNLTNPEQQKYFAENMGLVRATQTRAGLLPKNEEETLALQELQNRLQALADRSRPLRSSVSTGLKLTLLDLQQIQIAKKRSSTFNAKLNQSE